MRGIMREREDWVVVYEGEQPSVPMREFNAKNYLVIFDDALYMENKKTGKRLYRKELVAPEKLRSAHLILCSICCIITGYGFAAWMLHLGVQMAFHIAFCVGCFGVLMLFISLFDYIMDDPD